MASQVKLVELRLGFSVIYTVGVFLMDDCFVHIPVPSGVLPYVRFSFDFPSSSLLSSALFSSATTFLAVSIEAAFRGASGCRVSLSRRSDAVFAARLPDDSIQETREG